MLQVLGCTPTLGRSGRETQKTPSVDEIIGLSLSQRTEVQMHFHSSGGSVLSFFINQYTLARENGAEDTPGRVLLLDDVEV